MVKNVFNYNLALKNGVIEVFDYEDRRLKLKGKILLKEALFILLKPFVYNLLNFKWSKINL